MGAWLQGRSQERIEQRRIQHEERADRQQRRERAAEVLAEVSALLQDTHGELTTAERFPEVSSQRPEIVHSGVDQLGDRQKVASEQLILMAIREPSAKVRRLAQDLERALSSSVSATHMGFAARRTGQDSSAFNQFASEGNEGYIRALALLDKLVEAL